MSKIRIGIDIGQNGGYAIFVDDLLKEYGVIPSVGGELNMALLFDKFIVNDYHDNNYHVVIEDLHSVFGSSASSNFAFGINNGLIIGMLQTSSLPFTKVMPKFWQKQMWQGVRPVEIHSMEKKKKGQPAVQKRNKDGSPKYKIDTKATSLVSAQRLFPKEKFLATERSKVPHDGIVDACLLAAFCNRNF